jgi:hypothetical protein
MWAPMVVQQTLAVVGIVVLYVIALFWVIEKNSAKLAHEKVPMTLPKVGFVWFCISLVFFILWNSMNDTVPLNVPKRDWFSGGWAYNFYLFSIRIDTWWKYLIIVVYQVTRSVIGSMLSNIFKPFIMTEVQSKMLNVNTDISRRNDILRAQLAVTLFSYFSTITDIFLLLAQIDVSLISLVVTIITDGGATFMLLEYGIIQKKALNPPPPPMSQLLFDKPTVEKCGRKDTTFMQRLVTGKCDTHDATGLAV